MPPFLLRLADGVIAANRAIFHAVAWVVLLIVGVQFAVAVLRYALAWGSVGMQESVTYLHALVFMCAAAAGLASDSHVRVDIVYSRLGARGKALVDAVGALLLLLPFASFLLFASWHYVLRAWQLGETSSDAGGLRYVYLLKTLILVLGVQLVLQALASAVRAGNQLLRRGPEA